jgi:hypothetical protein
LSLYQDASEAMRFFRLLAVGKAREIRAVSFDLTGDCPISATFGAIGYKTGADIIEAIAKAYWCTGDQVAEVHIFSHAGPGGVYGHGGLLDEFGLYAEAPSAADQAGGGRSVADIQGEALAPDAVFVLHGCSSASGDDSFAELLLRTIVGTSPRARVYGHSESGTCGRDSDWREFSARHLEGRRRRRIPFHGGRR